MSELITSTAHETPTRKLWFEGANYTADAVVINLSKQCLLLIQRRDTREWALPGGFIDKNEPSCSAAAREVHEETGLLIKNDGTLVYQGPVDDPRNSKDTWIETSAHLFTIDDTPSLNGSDDAIDAQWMPLSSLPVLYGSHGLIVSKALEHLTAN